MIKQKSDCRLPKVLVQKVGDVAYIFINLNEEECSETDDEGNVHYYFIYDFNEFHVPVNSFDLKTVEAEPEKYIDYGDLIFAWSASFGAFIWQGDKVIYHYHIWKILFDDNLLNKIFYKFFLLNIQHTFII